MSMARSHYKAGDRVQIIKGADFERGAFGLVMGRRPVGAIVKRENDGGQELYPWDWLRPAAGEVLLTIGEVQAAAAALARDVLAGELTIETDVDGVDRLRSRVDAYAAAALLEVLMNRLIGTETEALTWYVPAEGGIAFMSRREFREQGRDS